jgi:phage FluMu protein Com
MSLIKVSDLEDATIEPSNENNESIVTKPKRVRPKKPDKTQEHAIVETTPEPLIEPLIEPPPEKHKQTKQQRTVTCINCGKELLEKTFKYYHQLKCKASEETVAPAINNITQPIQTQQSRNIFNTVDFNNNRRAAKQNKYTTLFSRAF